AGDTVTAIFTAAVAAGCDARVAGDLANLGAGIVVSEIGTVAVDHKRLQEQIEASQADNIDGGNKEE
ncbi:MAG: bifunctional heptose 7-phosphate kinase/heptose 1-phosphate adenyltransferase, partial [Proteobacteria bacterium]